MDDPIVLAIAIGLAVYTVYDIWCAWDTRRRYPTTLIKSMVWDRLIFGDTRVIAGSAIMLFLIFYGLLGYAFDWPPLRPWGSVLLAVAWVLITYGPIATRRMLRRLNGDD